ncbi:hypothetical protein [Amycolatopsis australiensis]|uniref:hypothetical protein n=1 Tax=Amycolatopsis australiensis TaxID=546364 RepID=UPI0015A6AAEB|nr:hypothetical protein [Amycolatopsis australiensis]
MLVVLAVPVVAAVALSLADYRYNRRVRALPSRTVAGIQARVARERAEAEAANASTEVLPRIQPTPADQPTQLLPRVLPKRPRRYVSSQRGPRPPARFAAPDPALMQRVLEVLRQLPEEPPARPSRWPGSDPDTESPPA